MPVRLTALALLLAGCATFQPPQPSAPAPAPHYALGDRVLPHDTLRLVSPTLGETRRINVYRPRAYAADPQRRFPVLYMPDGGLQEDFPHLTNAVDSLIAEGALPPLLVVGIENTQRRRDLTGPTTVASDRAISPRVGESAAFRRFLRDELLPEIARRYRTDDRAGLVGESLAGLFVMETMIEAPDLFDAYIALSPSLWWNAGAHVDAAPTWLALHPGLRARLYFASADEPTIVEAANRLAVALAAHAPRGLTWAYEPRPDLQHGTIYRGTKRRALTWTLEAWNGP